MRAVSFRFSAAGVTAYVMDRDSSVVGFVSTVSALLSRDLSETWANFLNPTANAVENLMIAICEVGSVSGNTKQDQLNIPLVKGETILVSISAKGSAVIYFEDAQPKSLS